MAYTGYLRYGQTELVNNERTYAHIEHGIAPRGMEVVTNDAWSETHVWLGDEPYVTPALTGAPWVDATVPASYEFAGIVALNVEGLDSTEIEQDITEGTGDGGSAMNRRLPTRPVTVEGVAVAETSRGLQWGLRWLNRVLLSEDCAEESGPRDLIFLESHPWFIQKEQPNDTLVRANELTRMLTRVVTTQTPEVSDRHGRSMGRADHAPTAARVEFELTALVPRVWSNPVTLLTPRSLAGGEVIGTRFTEPDEDGSCPADCDTETGVLVDPAMGPLWTLPRPSSAAADIGCQLLESRRSLFTISEGAVPLTGQMLPTVTVRAGNHDERHIRIRWARGLVTDDGRALDCQTVGEAMITYIPAYSTVTLDGRSGTATAALADGSNVDATPVTVGRAGGPWRAPVLYCGAPYTVVVDADTTTDATVEITGVSGEV